MSDGVIQTKRLALRPWRDADFDVFAQMNADPRVMRYFPNTLNREESDQLATRICTAIQQQGWGFWAVSIPGKADFIGCVGLAHVTFEAPFTPAVEVGWRLHPDYWNQGYATEGALAAIQDGFKRLRIDEIVALTTPQNLPSRRVMEKLGMSYDEKDDFDHPKVAVGHPLRRHVLYRIKTGHFTQIWESPPDGFQALVEVSACYLEKDGKVLFVKRSPQCIEGKLWGVPAGKLEPKETAHAAAKRELFEETGIDLAASYFEKIGTLYVQKPRGQYLYHMFQVHIDKMPEVHLSAEHTEYRWLDVEQAIEEMPLVGGGKHTLRYYQQNRK